MATTQMPIDGVFDKDSGALLGFAAPGGGEMSLVSGAGIPFSSLPAPSSMVGTVRVSDIGAHGSLWYSDGLSWGLVGGQCVLGQSAVAATVTASSTTEEVLGQVALPAGVLGINGALRLTTLWSVVGAAGTKTFRARLGATALTGSAWLAIVQGTGNASVQPMPQVLRNRGVVNSQVTYPAGNGGMVTATATAMTLTTEDTSVATVFALTGQKATGSETCTLEGWTLELLRP